METNITRLLQLAALAQVKRLEQVTIDPEGNPVVSLALWRAFLIYRLNHLNLQRINGTEVHTPAHTGIQAQTALHTIDRSSIGSSVSL